MKKLLTLLSLTAALTGTSFAMDEANGFGVPALWGMFGGFDMPEETTPAAPTEPQVQMPAQQNNDSSSSEEDHAPEQQ